MNAPANNRRQAAGWLAPKTNGLDYLRKLAACPEKTFEHRFAKTSTQLALGTALRADELDWLYEAAFQAVLCNIAFNGLGGCHGKIKPERENHRRQLEQHFMAARHRFFATAGWKQLPLLTQSLVEDQLLSVSVFNRNLAF